MRWAIAAVVAVLAVASAVYLNTSYPAGDEARAALTSDAQVTVAARDDGSTVFTPAEGAANGAGLIFYPGGKVEPKAYAPLMRAAAERGFTCVLVRFPFNLAVFDVNAASGVQEAFPQVERWYIGGHSLGGAMAAAYAADHAGDFRGLLLCGAYATKDLGASGLAVTSVYGTDDGVLNRDAYAKNRGNIPQAVEDTIEGGCHSYFGDYGLQDGDGTPTISRDEQIARTVDDLAAMDRR
ncbi:MAG: alpha/beta hydrolase [Eggerthellaceae bacterium]|nr:alpha/beta hydrolase [Eggerthellaceae bacterium]